jgi:hypothetical protein
MGMHVNHLVLQLQDDLGRGACDMNDDKLRMMMIDDGSERPETNFKTERQISAFFSFNPSSFSSFFFIPEIRKQRIPRSVTRF